MAGDFLLWAKANRNKRLIVLTHKKNRTNQEEPTQTTIPPKTHHQNPTETKTKKKSLDQQPNQTIKQQAKPTQQKQLTKQHCTS